MKCTKCRQQGHTHPTCGKPDPWRSRECARCHKTYAPKRPTKPGGSSWAAKSKYCSKSCASTAAVSKRRAGAAETGIATGEYRCPCGGCRAGREAAAARLAALPPRQGPSDYQLNEQWKPVEKVDKDEIWHRGYKAGRRRDM